MESVSGGNTADHTGVTRAARERIDRQVQWLADQPDGLLYERRSGMHKILVIKEGSEIRLHFANLSIHAQFDGISGRMSELDLTDPLLPFAPYTQGMMLTLLWKDRPQRVYTIGFGAGRVPSILEAYMPELLLESTEIDKDVLVVAEKFFGYLPSPRQKVVVQDGREYLAARPLSTQYDFIHVDAFRGFGNTPFSLGTVEFYDICKKHLVEGGVVCANLVPSDGLFKARIRTMAASFRNAYLFVHEDATVLYGSNAPRMTSDAFTALGRDVQARYLFTFPLDQLAGKLKHVDECEPYLRNYAQVDAVLTDARPPAELSAIPRTDPMFFNVGRNEPCPCGSGKKFKKCHGQ